MKNEIKIEDLGYNDFFESNRIKLKFDDFAVARVISEYKGGYKVKNTDGEYFAKITGKQMFDALSREDYPAVGDWVVVKVIDEKLVMIRAVLPRETMIKRRYGDKNKADEKDKTQIIATNIDVAFVVESIDRDYNLNRLERYLAIAGNGGVKPIIVINKIDLITEDELDEKLNQIKNRLPGVEVVATSTVNEKGLEEIKNYIIKGKTYCFLGSSGVGKSSLVNKLLGKNIIKTENISSYSGRGKHVTTSREMFFLENGGIVIDNPGIREVGLTEATEGIEDVFDEIVFLAKNCKYTDCTHIHEPGCEVRKAVESGKLDEGKLANFSNLKKEAKYYGMNDSEKREKKRKFGKFVKKTLKQLKNIGFKNYE